MNANRYRRIVKFDPKTHYGDVQVTRECRRIREKEILIRHALAGHILRRVVVLTTFLVNSSMASMAPICP